MHRILILFLLSAALLPAAGQPLSLSGQYDEALRRAAILFPQNPQEAARQARQEIETRGSFQGSKTLTEQYLEAYLLAFQKLYAGQPRQEELARIWAVPFFERQGAFSGDKTLDEQYHEALILAHNRFFNNYEDRESRARSWAKLYLEKNGRFSPQKGKEERYREAYNLAFFYLFPTAAAREYEARQWADRMLKF